MNTHRWDGWILVALGAGLAGCSPLGTSLCGIPPASGYLDPCGELAAVSAAPIRAQEGAGSGSRETSGVRLASGPHAREFGAPPRAEPLPAPAAADPAGPLELPAVIHSVQASFPLLEAALQERQIAAGKQLAACGEFDLNLELYGIAAPQGYYQNYRNGIGWEQPTARGGYLYGAYRIADGDIQPWFKERLTNEGGEFRLGLGLPLAQNRAIDKRRLQVLQAGLARQAVEPSIQGQLLDFVRAASDTYWSWVAAGQLVLSQREQLRLATERAEQIEERVRGGDLEPIARIDNQRLIAGREAKLIEAERKLQMAAIKLSLFLRGPDGAPQVPPDERLPADFPTHVLPNAAQLERDIQAAQAARPELRELELLRRQVAVELAQAENMLLPKVDAKVEASKDVGAPADAKGDKTPFELEAGLYGELPLQRREARGKIQAARGKLAQLAAKREYYANRIEAEVRDAVSALVAAHGRIERARINHELTHQSLDLGRTAFQAGDLTLVTLNLYEQATLEAELQLIEAQLDYFQAEAAYRAALALDPLAE